MADDPQNPGQLQQPAPAQGEQTDTVEHICAKCGKTIKPGEGFTHQGIIYCCEHCCKRIDKPQNMCEFC